MAAPSEAGRHPGRVSTTLKLSAPVAVGTREGRSMNKKKLVSAFVGAHPERFAVQPWPDAYPR